MSAVYAITSRLPIAPNRRNIQGTLTATLYVYHYAMPPPIPPVTFDNAIRGEAAGEEILGEGGEQILQE